MYKVNSLMCSEDDKKRSLGNFQAVNDFRDLNGAAKKRTTQNSAGTTASERLRPGILRLRPDTPPLGARREPRPRPGSARAPARWQLQRDRSCASAACVACCSSSRSSTFYLVVKVPMKCPSSGLCSRLPADCIDCATNFSCVYGKPVTFDCTVKPSVTCVDQDFKSQKSFIINMTCRFCWQLPETDYECSNSTSCMTVSCPRQRYTTNCTVRDHIHCLGNRTFPKMLYCNWTGGYKWSTAMALSITLGGFGADRFYLGQWREGLGKLFSFGGLGILTLIDVLLIGVGYVGLADGSLYI
ncbi:TM2 domain-containing protein 3-like isoform 1-T1 [Callospermophilus lateralis]|uniref:TM2 domain-containing protein 3-like isoform X1 n=2 Tax=Callospermophilus lateralis TaxID=76772 RepID=UPI0040540B51